MLPFSPIIKCVDTACNLRCQYCTYRYVEQSVNRVPVMSGEVLERFTAGFMSIKQPRHDFLWHGGEPLLAGIGFFEKAVKLQKRHNSDNLPVSNSVQTNGTLLTWEVAEFFKEHGFRVGISLDGPEHVHNRYRTNGRGNGSFSRVMRGVKLCQAAGVPVSAIAVITDYGARFPEEIYRFFLSEGIKRFALNPVFELDQTGKVCDFSVSDGDFGRFLSTMMELWLEDDDPDVFIRQFSEPLSALLGEKVSTCIYSGQCAGFLDVYPNGDVKSCHNLLGESFVLGNFMAQPLREILSGDRYEKFAKQISHLSQTCLRCRWLKLCNGGCADQRNLVIDERFHDKYVYCNSRKKIFSLLKRQIARVEGERR